MMINVTSLRPTHSRMEVFKPETIKNIFTAAGLVPYNPDQVILKLDIQLRTPPPGSRVVVGSKNAFKICVIITKTSLN